MIDKTLAAASNAWPFQEAFAILERTHDVMAILKEKIYPSTSR